MATIYLPLGFPIQSGTFNTLVFQGQVVRQYTLAEDPRTDDQLWRRKLFSDISKMRGSMGEYVKAACRIQFGTKWTSVLGQMCMGNVDGYWATAWDEWDVMTQAQRDYLNENAPYVVTWNEPGRVWWAMYQTLFNWNEDHGGNKFHMPAIQVNDPDAGWGWWLATFDKYDFQVYADVAKWFDSSLAYFGINGSWPVWNGPGPRDNNMRIGSTVNGYLEVQPSFNHCKLWYGKNTDRGNLDIYYNGDVQVTIDCNGAEAYQFKYDVGLTLPASQPLRFYHGGPVGKLVDVDGVELWTNYKGDYCELTGTGWTTVSNAGAVDGYYHERQGVGEVSYYFNFYGRYAKIYFPKKPIYTNWSFWVDDVYFGGVNAYSATEVQGQSAVVGPFRKTLHRCEVRAPGGDVAVDLIKIRDLKKDL